MFLKSSQLPTIDQYPYSFSNLQSDYPNTSFPVDFLSENNPELNSFNVYFIYDSTPTFPENIVITNKFPIYNNELNRFEFDYEVRELTSQELFEQRYNPVQFMEDLADNLIFQIWANQVKSELQFNLMMIAFQNQKYDRVQMYYEQLKLLVPPSELAISQWQIIANNNGINLKF